MAVASIVAIILLAITVRSQPPPVTRNTTGPGFHGYCIGLQCPGSGPAHNPKHGVVLMGGSTPIDEAYAWQISNANQGNFLIFSASIPDQYNAYIWELSKGTLLSVTTIMLTLRDGAYQTFVVEAARSADAIFFAGGDQTLYVERITGTPLGDVLRDRQSALTFSGTSAGCDFLSDMVFAPPEEAPSVESPGALSDPYEFGISFAPSPFRFPEFGRIGPDPAFLDDTHFFQRDRMGRLLVFGARLVNDGTIPAASCARLVAVNEQSALLIDGGSGIARVVGNAVDGVPPAAFVCSLCAAPTVCAPGRPLSAGPFECVRLGAGEEYDFSSWTPARGAGVAYNLSVSAGRVDGAPYGPGYPTPTPPPRRLRRV